MSRNRQRRIEPEETIFVRSLALRLPPGYPIETHEHPWAQLIYATHGVMSVFTAEGTWVVPSHRAVWVPAGIEHRLEMTGSVAMQTLYLRSDLTKALPRQCRVIPVAPLLRELILETVKSSLLYSTVPQHARLAGVLIDQVVETPEAPLDLRFPTDPRARRLADRVIDDPANNASLEVLSQGTGASPRTLERLFLNDLGTTFGRWRQQVRLLRALRLLAAGATVSATGHEVGYESTSAFIAMFKRCLGKTPRRYYLSPPQV